MPCGMCNIVLHGVNAANKSEDLLQQPKIEHASTDVPDHRTACAATQGIITSLHTAIKSNLSSATSPHSPIVCQCVREPTRATRIFTSCAGC